MLHGEPVKNPGKMSSYWKREWRVVALIVTTGILFNASLSLGPILQGNIIDGLLAGDGLEQVLPAVCVFLLVIGGIQWMRFLKRKYVRVFANRTGAAMRRTVYSNLLHRPLSALREETTGDLMTKAISDVDACVEGMRKFTTEIFDTGVLMVSYCVTLLCYDVQLTLCACLFLPVAMAIAEGLKRLVFRVTKAYRAQLSALSELTYETVENALLYRICSAEETNLSRYRAQLERLEKRAVRANLLENSMQPIYNVIAMTGVFFIVLLGGRSVVDGSWTVGAFSAYLTIFTALAVKASKAAKLVNSVQKAQVSWRRVQPYLTEERREETATFPAVSELRVEQLSFTYPGADSPTLREVSFAGRAGQIIGVTGPVAGGKSTLGLALLGLYPYGGSIRLDGRELRDSPANGAIAYLGHDSQLLSDTIYNNITLGDGGDVGAVLSDVCFDRDLETMPLGVQTPVGASGVRLSGGQQARLALARALYGKSGILVLDDPFSAVDRETETQIFAHLRAHYADRLIVLISRTAGQADTVVRVENGTATTLPDRAGERGGDGDA
ncbi:MAG: ABC transporter ATP-binding protein [Oscillospiraceae bacterium]